MLGLCPRSTQPPRLLQYPHRRSLGGGFASEGTKAHKHKIIYIV
eukprot:COSAG06_NODE_73964_length_149_cov_2079.980000_1_plen_43_part_10